MTIISSMVRQAKEMQIKICLIFMQHKRSLDGHSFGTDCVGHYHETSTNSVSSVLMAWQHLMSLADSTTYFAGRALWKKSFGF